jgi:hypothetical protein
MVTDPFFHVERENVIQLLIVDRGIVHNSNLAGKIVTEFFGNAVATDLDFPSVVDNWNHWHLFRQSGTTFLRKIIPTKEFGDDVINVQHSFEGTVRACTSRDELSQLPCHSTP